MYQIFWSSEAKDTYSAIVQYAMDNFPLDVAIKMDEKVERLLTLLEQNKHLCPASRSFPNARKCVVTKHLSLIYRILGNDIELVVFFDNRSDHPF